MPNEDQDFLIVDIQAPPEASANHTRASVERIEAIFRDEPAVENVVAIQGFSFSGMGANAAIAFVTLKDWAERSDGNSVQEIANRANMKLLGLKDATAFALSLPPIEGFGTANGFSFRLQDRSGLGQEALKKANAELMAKAGSGAIVTGLRVEGMPDAAQVMLVIDREKANTFGVSFADINNAITANLGSSYINDYPNAGGCSASSSRRRTAAAFRSRTCSGSTCATPTAAWCPCPRWRLRNGARARRRSWATTAIRR